MEEYLKGLLAINKEIDYKALSPLVLAYVGDACFELYIRQRVITDNVRLPTQKLHRLTVNFVRASSQSDIIHGIWEELEESERAVVKRGRNAKSGTSPKNAHIIQYRYATGFEALVGYLFIKGDMDRLMYILDKSYDFFCLNNK